VWICENGWRIVATVIAMMIGVVFTEPILGVKLNHLTAFLAGFFTDKTVEAITNRKK
jgi:hypothetical protein